MGLLYLRHRSGKKILEEISNTDVLVLQEDFGENSIAVLDHMVHAWNWNEVLIHWDQFSLVWYKAS